MVKVRLEVPKEFENEILELAGKLDEDVDLLITGESSTFLKVYKRWNELANKLAMDCGLRSVVFPLSRIYVGLHSPRSFWQGPKELVIYLPFNSIREKSKVKEHLMHELGECSLSLTASIFTANFWSIAERDVCGRYIEENFR